MKVIPLTGIRVEMSDVTLAPQIIVDQLGIFTSWDTANAKADKHVSDNDYLQVIVGPITEVTES